MFCHITVGNITWILLLNGFSKAFTQIFFKYFLLGIVLLGTESTTVNQRDKNPCPH